LFSAQDVLKTNPIARPQTLEASLGGRVIRGAFLFWLLSDATLIPVGRGQAERKWLSFRQKDGSPPQAARPPLRDDQARSQEMIRVTRPFSGLSSGRSARFALILPRSGMTI